jgi:hypothetical protein
MKRNNLLILGFVLLKFLLQYLALHSEYEIHRDEFLHLDLANHLAWGYLSVPPVIAWFALIIQFLGNSFFWIKFFPALFGALTIVLVCKTVESLGGNTFALILAGTGVLLSSLLRLNTLFQPNSLDVLCWTAIFFIAIKFIQTKNKSWLFAGALVVAIGFLNKYNVVFLMIGLIPAILISNQRKVFKEPMLYVAVLLCLLLIAPNLIWQYNRHFPVFHHLKELSEIQLVHVDRVGFIRSQFFFFIGSILVIFAGFYGLLFYKPFRNFRFIFWTFVFTMACFIYLKAKDYYAIGLYPIYIGFGAVFLGEILKKGILRHLRIVLIAIPVLFFIPIFRWTLPNNSPDYILKHIDKYQKLGMLRWEDGKDHTLPQDFADMLGWEEMAAKVDAVYDQRDRTKRTLVLCDNYGQAGAVNYYSRLGIKAVSLSGDYIGWFDLTDPYVNIIRVINRNELKGELAEIVPFFEKTQVLDSITNENAREYGSAIVLFEGAKIEVNPVLQQEIEERTIH